MKNKMKFKIGEFSKLCQVTVKTLRHYEEIGLMIPVEVDEWTGYRYYDISQLRCMSRIVYLKQLGFSLEEISELFADGKEFPDAEFLSLIGKTILEIKYRTAVISLHRNGIDQHDG